ncbi:MAG TPA: pilus assembly protein TadG-related protein [Anaerolineales bacterium]|nr:pilus assembly protein TadG-related protein [Anaerolineales bacterium]
MKPRLQERGQALILIVFAAVGLFAFAALAIDGSRVFSDRRHAQNAADTAVMAAALAKVRGTDYADAAVKRAESNGFTLANSTVEVHLCNEADLAPPCEGLPAGADLTQYIQVVIRMSTPTTFARILGWQEVPTVVSAIARSVTSGAPVGGSMAAVSAMSEHDPAAIDGNGNFTLDINNGGVFSNSDNNCAFVTDGASGRYEVDPGFAFDVVGDYCPNGIPTLFGDLNRDATQIPYPPNIQIPAPSITCSVPSHHDTITNTYTPGYHLNKVNGSGTVTFAPGNHCFKAGLELHGNTGMVANDVNFLIEGGDFFYNANGSLNCNNMLVHINGGTGVQINGNSTSTCTNVTFYATHGDVSLAGNSLNSFSAPTSGPYKGLLIYLPYGNPEPVKVTGNAGSQFTGSIIGVSSQIEVQGNTQTLALSTQIIGYTVKFSGNGDIVINYDPAKQYAQGEPTMIQLTK